MRLSERRIKFAKMHGAGNDYIYVESSMVEGVDLHRLARVVSDRHTGIGSDGLVVIGSSDIADFRMRMFNSDGSEAQMCGNASRCIAKYVYEKALTSKTELTLETNAGVKTLSLHLEGPSVASVTVDMGSPVLDPTLVPARHLSSAPIISETINAAGIDYDITAVGMGNPHGIIFCNDMPDDRIVCDCGPILERHEIWPEKANIEFVKVIDRNHVSARVWERGSGETQACGTGACAVCVASSLNNLTDRHIKVTLPGGELDIDWNNGDNHVYLTGRAEWVCEGDFFYSEQMAV